MQLEKIGRYEITAKLGRGAMGIVYKAMDPTIGRMVALKTMHFEMHGSNAEEMSLRFRNEARAAGVMNHPNIVTIYDAHEIDDLFYIAMEYIEGETLQSVLARERTLPVETVTEYSRQICAGLDYAHRMGVIHRDIKPANLMITKYGQIKIMDFGIAKASTTLTSDGQIVGTPGCMSPEQVKGRPLDGRSDLFSYGVVLYEMLTGQKPFPGESIEAAIYKILHVHPLPPRDIDASIHPGLSAIVLKALAKVPESRYQTGAELVRDLENYKSITGNSPGDEKMKAAAAEGGKQVAIPAPAGAAPAAAAPAKARNLTPVPRAASLNRQKKSSSGRWLTSLIIVVIVLGGAIAALEHFQPARLRAVNRFAFAMKQKAMPAYLFVRSKLHRIPAQATVATETKPAEPKAPEVQPAAGDAQAKAAEAKSGEAVSSPAQAPPAISQSASATPITAANAASPAANSTAEVEFTSTPAGATVQIDGKSDPAWVTPFTKSDLQPGRHNIVFSKAGYLTETHELEIAAGKSNYDLDLTSTNATLNLASTPDGAHIEIDGKDSGKTTPAQISVEKGKHTIVLRLGKYSVASTVAKVNEGDFFDYHPVLKAAMPPPAASDWQGVLNALPDDVRSHMPDKMGALEVRSTPAGAFIVINGRNSGRLTPQHGPFPPGDYLVTLKLDGYKPVTRIIHVEAGKQPVVVDEKLERK